MGIYKDNGNSVPRNAAIGVAANAVAANVAVNVAANVAANVLAAFLLTHSNYVLTHTNLIIKILNYKNYLFDTKQR